MAMRLDLPLALLSAELRSARRSSLIWLVAAGTVGGGFALYTYFAELHAAGYAPPPRFATPSLGLVVLWIALLGVSLVTAGLRARDERAGIADALDARPMSNLALLLGRMCAVVLPAWLALAALGGLLQIVGWAAPEFDRLTLGEPLEPVALATFLLLDAPPTLLFWATLATLLAAVMPNRGVVAASMIALLALGYFGLLHVPMHLLPALAGITGLGLPGSDILPRYPTGADVAQRLALLLLAAGFLVAAATALRRGDQFNRRGTVASAFGLVVVGAAGIGALATQATAAAAERRAWAAAHLQEPLHGAPRVDVERIAGRVDIDPGRALTLDLRLHVHVPEELDGKPMRFSLNPGLAVSAVTVDGEQAGHEFALGLLTIAPSPSAAAGQRIVGIRASGRPDARFAYPDTAVAALEESLAGHPLALLGEQALLFEEDFVALLPGAHWLPRADVTYSASLEAGGERDHRAIDLEVYLPPGWHAVGAGRDGAADKLRFRPATPLAEFALFAAPWRPASATIGGVECEFLLHPKHARRLARLREFAGPVVARYEGHLKSLAQERLPYVIAAPSGPMFAIVEVPALLRRYGGGKQMDSIGALPGVQLLPEHGLPTARLRESTLQGDVAGLDLVPNLGANGVPLHFGVWRKVLPFLTNAAGEAATPLNLLLEHLVAHRFLQGGRVVLGAAGLDSTRGTAAPTRLLHRLFGAVSVQTPPDADSSFGAHVQSAGQIAAALRGAWANNAGTATFLAALRARHGGATFTLADFTALLREQAPEFTPIVRHWLAEGALPGYFTSPVFAARLADGERGEARYQVRLHVRNGEPAPGLVRLGWRVKGWPFRYGPPVQVPAEGAVELGAILPAPPAELQLDTFLSLNRGAVRLRAPPVDPQRTEAGEALIGSQPSDWRPKAADDDIIVDDLDEAFSTRSVVTPGLRFTRQVVTATGPNVPAATTHDEPRWVRLENWTTLAWGRYRRSSARIAPGSGESQATFAATLPSAGRWRLAYHLPGPTLLAGSMIVEFLVPNAELTRFGTFDLTIAAGEKRLPAPFDGADAVPGWNTVGTFELPAGEVRVIVSDRTSGDLVVADAIRWTPAAGPDALGS